jgi:hypothetical protein
MSSPLSELWTWMIDERTATRSIPEKVASESSYSGYYDRYPSKLDKKWLIISELGMLMESQLDSKSDLLKTKGFRYYVNLSSGE